MKTSAVAIAFPLIVMGSMVLSKAGLAQCASNPPIGMMGFSSSTCFGDGTWSRPTAPASGTSPSGKPP